MLGRTHVEVKHPLFSVPYLQALLKEGIILYFANVYKKREFLRPVNKKTHKESLGIYFLRGNIQMICKNLYR